MFCTTHPPSHPKMWGEMGDDDDGGPPRQVFIMLFFCLEGEVRGRREEAANVKLLSDEGF